MVEKVGRKVLLEHHSKRILEKYGIRTSMPVEVRDEEEAVRVAREMGFPVVMKVVAVHKSDVGGVVLDLRDEESVREAFRKLARIVEEGRAEGITVQPMLEKGIEIIVGVTTDEQFGRVMMFGLGGVFVEVIRDVSFRLMPLSREDAEEMVREIKGYRLLEGYRGVKGDVDSLVDLMLKLNEVVEREKVVELDLNPVIVYEKGCVVADARMVVGEGVDLSYTVGNLDELFYPRSVAVVGASRTVGKPGYNIVWNLKQHGFKGKIYPVNPNADKILDLKCYARVTDIPDDVDLVIIAVPARIVPEIMKDCAEKGVKGVVIVSSGFSEEGEIGAEYERQILEVARKSGIRIFGPNTTGVLNTDNGLITSFAMLPIIKDGSIGLIAQTGLFLGIMMGHVATNHPSIGFSKVVGLGNKIDVEDYEVLDFLLKDEKTSVVAMYIEGFRNGRAFYDVAKKAEKPVVVFKSGRTEYGKKAALSHTASICGNDDVFNAVCRQANIARVFSFEEMINVSKAFSMQPLPRGNRVALIHYTGSGCVQGADAIHFANLKLADLSDETVEAILDVTPEWHRVNNPLDIWPMVEYNGVHKAYSTAIEAMMSDDNVDSMIVAVWAGSDLAGWTYHPDFRKLREFGKPIYFVIEGLRDSVYELKNDYELHGFPSYPDVITAVNVLGKVTRYATRKRQR